MSREMNEIEKLLEMIKEAAAFKKELEKNGREQPDTKKKIEDGNYQISYSKDSVIQSELIIEGDGANLLIGVAEIIKALIRCSPKRPRKHLVDFIRVVLNQLEDELNEENND